METLYQVALQIVLLFFTQTNTPTTGGLESFFAKKTFLGLEIDPTWILVIFVGLSLKSCIFQHIKAVSAEKGFFGLKAKLAVFAWAVFATIRKVASIVCFFTPSLGLFNLLHHWQAENTPFKARLEESQKLINNDVQHFQTEKIELYNMTEEVSWASLDRWDYQDPEHPTPPPYSIYTGISLQHTFFAFMGLIILQILMLVIVKLCTSKKFCEEKNYFHKLTHLFQITNLPFPYEDWDVGNYDSVSAFRERYNKIQREMLASYAVTFVSTLISMIPLAVTGNPSLIELQSALKVQILCNFFLFSV